MMPKPQHLYTTRDEAARACLIAGAPWRSAVLGSIDLNRPSHCGARAIQHEAFDGVLPAKAATVQLFATKVMPHFRTYMPDQAQYPRRDNAPDPKGYFAWEEGMPLTFA